MTDPSTPVPSDEAVRAAHADLMRPRCRTVIVDRRNVPSALAAAYAIDAPRIAAEAAAEARAERDAAILERDEMRKANVTPEDAGRPLGQSVEYWQDRALDYATAHDKARVEIAQLRAQLGDRAEARAATLAAVEAWLEAREVGTARIADFRRTFRRPTMTPEHTDMAGAARYKVCAECGTEASRVAGRRRGSGYWWCWRCEKAIQPVESETRR